MKYFDIIDRNLKLIQSNLYNLLKSLYYVDIDGIHLAVLNF